MAGGRGESITRFTTGTAVGDPLSPTYQESMREVLLPQRPAPGEPPTDGLRWILDGLSISIRDRAERLVQMARELAVEDGGINLVLLHHLAELTSNLVQLPPNSILPPLGAAEDSVATALGAALAAEGDGDANRQLSQVFQFLGGRYVAEAEHSVFVCSEPPPREHIARWQWFCGQVRQGRKRADALWPQIVDPPS
jgi:hypothetical protein